MEDTTNRWLAWARELQAMAQTGLTFSLSDYDTVRYTRLAEIAAEMTSAHTTLAREDILESFSAQPGYATVKVDVRGAVIDDGGRILLVKEREDGKWCMPGGWADVGEIPSEMVKREIREESGIIAEPRRITGVYDANRVGSPLEFYHAYKIVFLCEMTGGEPCPSDETSAAAFFAFDAIPELSEQRTNRRHLADVRACLEDPSRPAAFD